MTKRVTVLGSTGSIGESTLRVISLLKEEYTAYGLACGSNLKILEKQIEEFNPEIVAVGSKEACLSDHFKKLKKLYPHIEFLEGEEGIIELAKKEVDLLVSAIVGAAGLRPTMAAIGPAKRIALANKETLVVGGTIVMDQIQEKGVELIPVDSEHSAIFSLLCNIDDKFVERIVLTASGGSLRNIPIEKLKETTPMKALEHPTWNMGSKITIDSATLMNKGLEVIEAHHLFKVPYDSIDILIHPESIVHSLVETIDGSLYGHLGIADMALPILNAFTYPDKVKNHFGRLKLEEVGTLSFFKYDKMRYPALDLCYEAGRQGGTMPAVLNAVNEVTVNAFLEKKLLFTDIVKIVEKALADHSNITNPTLENLLDIDRESREMALQLVSGEK